MFLLLTVTRSFDLGYTLAGGVLVATGVVLWMFAAAEKLNRADRRPEPVPVHPDDWHPTAPLWDETEQETP